MWWMMDRETMLEWSGRVTVGVVLAAGILLMGCGGDEPQARTGERSPRTRSVEAAQQPEVQPASYTVDAPVPDPEFAVTGPVSYEEAEDVFHEGRYRDAVRLFSRYVEDTPSNAWGYYMLGLSAWKAGALPEAEGAFRTALELDPLHRKSVHNLGRVLIEDGRPDEAERLLREALLEDSSVGETWRLVGRACQDRGDIEGAITAYEQAVTLDTNDVWALNNLGLVHIRRGQFEEAIPPLARAALLAPDQPVFQNNLGIALEAVGQFTLAREAFGAALAADSSYRKAEVSLARVGDRPDDAVRRLDLQRLAESVVEDRRPEPAAVPVPDSTDIEF